MRKKMFHVVGSWAVTPPWRKFRFLTEGGGEKKKNYTIKTRPRRAFGKEGGGGHLGETTPPPLPCVIETPALFIRR